MKKIFNFIKNKKDEDAIRQEEEVKQPADDDDIPADQDNSTRDKDSTSTEDQTKEAKLEEIRRSQLHKKVIKFESILSSRVVDLEKLKNLSWNGIPSTDPKLRAETWRLLLDYQPNDLEIAQETLARKREEYTDMVEHYFGLISFDSVQELLSQK